MNTTLTLNRDTIMNSWYIYDNNLTVTTESYAKVISFVPVFRDVSEITGAPEMLGGRVKTLHPAVHGGTSSTLDGYKTFLRHACLSIL